jgi:hypothetical protein
MTIRPETFGNFPELCGLPNASFDWPAKWTDLQLDSGCHEQAIR